MSFNPDLNTQAQRSNIFKDKIQQYIRNFFQWEIDFLLIT